jgi:hypothetical protein
MVLPLICEVILTVQLRSLFALAKGAGWQIVPCIHNTRQCKKWWRRFEKRGINEQQEALKITLVVSITSGLL